MRRIQVLQFLAGLAFLLATLTLMAWVLISITDDPILDAVPRARVHARDVGYSVEGFLGDYVTEPDPVGGCEVELKFVNSTMNPPNWIDIRLKRKWYFGDWHITDSHVLPLH